MKSVSYSSPQLISCSCGNDVILCVANELTADGAPYIVGTLTLIDQSLNYAGACIYNYGITYEEGQLADPDTDLTSCDINGIVCKGCLTDYIEWLVAHGAPV